GVALVMVVLILAGILAIALPLAYISRSNETSSARTLDQETARRFAVSALEMAKGQLRRGSYENEFRATYPPPTLSPTPTPTNAANLVPYTTPDYDAHPELVVPSAELDAAIPPVLPNGDTLSVSVEVEDEQGKINLNSVTPLILRGLYLAVFRIDVASLSSDDRAALKARFEHVIDPIAMARFSTGTYTPLRSVEQIRNFAMTDGNDTYQLTDAEYDALKPFLTVYSWRPSADGFTRVSEHSFVFGAPPTSLDFAVSFRDCPYRVDYLDGDKMVVKTYYLLPQMITDAVTGLVSYFVTVPEAPPSNCYYAAFTREEFHPVNINNAPFTVLLAFCLAPLDIDDPKFSLSDAIADAKGMKAVGRVRNITSTTGGYTLELIPDSDDFTFKVPSLVACGQSYFSVSYDSATTLKSSDDLSGLIASDQRPLDISTVVLGYNNLFTTAEQTEVPPFATYLAQANRALFTRVSYDIYTLRSECSLQSPEGLEKAHWLVTEVVNVGGPRLDDTAPLSFDNLTDFGGSFGTTNSSVSFAGPQKREITASWAIDNAPGASGFLETAPPSFWLSPDIQLDLPFSDGSGTYAWFGVRSNTSSASMNQSAMHIAGWFANALEAHPTSRKVLAYSRASSRRSFFSERDDQSILADDIGPTYVDIVPGNDCFAVGGWFKAQGWDPSSDTTMHRLFGVQPATAGVTGSTQLYIQNGLLTLRVEDDNGVAGTFSYRLTAQNFPRETWMYIVCHIGGNQPGQCSIFVDNRPVLLEYSTSASRSDGYCIGLTGKWPCTFPVITADVDADPATLDVDSTEGYPDTGYMRVEDEVIFYGAKTATSFLSLRREIGGTKPSLLPVGTKILPAAIIAGGFDSAFWHGGTPKVGDEVTLLSYTASSKDRVFRKSGRDPQKMTLDMDSVFDQGPGAYAHVFCAPKNAAFSTTLPLDENVFVFCGTSSTTTSGDPETGKVQVFFFSAPGKDDGFVGDSGFEFIAKPKNPPCRITDNIDPTTTEIYLSYSISDAISFLVQVDDEIIGISKLNGVYSPAQRGMLGTTPAAHKAGTWALPLDWFSVAPLPVDLDANTTSYLDPTNALAYNRCSRIDDEIVRISYEYLPAEKIYVYKFARGVFGSVPAAHTAGTLAVQFPCLAPSVYDFDDKNGTQTNYFEFRRNRPGARLLGLTWSELLPADPYVLLHFWADVADDRDFVREPVSPNVFHFTSKSTDFSISRGSEPVITDNYTIRVMNEYLRGAWLPNDPTRHSWKLLPQVDKIDLWVQEPDIVFEHTERP
ncbi:MAG: hypothetical protein WC712_11670, partial [Candidatus Brocadiia bacterium]